MLSADIVSFVKAVNPKTIIPVHSFEPGHFKEHFINVMQLQDGELCQVD